MKKILTMSALLLFVGNIMSNPEGLRNGIHGYGTHFPALATLVANTSGPILEMGCGDYSTPMLHALCAPTKRMLVSTDVDADWINLFMDMKRDWHSFIYVPAYEKKSASNSIWFSVGQDAWDVVGSDTHWSIVFIDHSPGLRRIHDIERLRSHTDIFIAHDADDERYEYDRIKPFKYFYTYKRYHVTTIIMSDTVDVAKFFDL